MHHISHWMQQLPLPGTWISEISVLLMLATPSFSIKRTKDVTSLCAQHTDKASTSVLQKHCKENKSIKATCLLATSNRLQLLLTQSLRGNAKIILSHYSPNKSGGRGYLTTFQCSLPFICLSLWLVSLWRRLCVLLHATEGWAGSTRLGRRVLRQGTISGETLAELPLISREMFLWPFLIETQARSPEIWTSKNSVHKSFVHGMGLFPHSVTVKWRLNLI